MFCWGVGVGLGGRGVGGLAALGGSTGGVWGVVQDGRVALGGGGRSVNEGEELGEEGE